MIKFFRTVLRREPGTEYDPSFSYYSVENSFKSLETKYDVKRLRKFMIIRKNYVVFGIVTDLDNITEGELEIITTITSDKTLFNSIIDTVKVVILKFKEWYYPTDINIDKGIRLIINHRNSSLLINSDNIFKLLELDDNRWECIMNTDVPEEDLITFYRIFNAEVNYGRKRRKIF